MKHKNLLRCNGLHHQEQIYMLILSESEGSVKKVEAISADGFQIALGPNFQ